MKLSRLALIICTLTIASLVNMAVAQDSSPIVGNAIGETPTMSGPASIRVDMSDCQFSMTIMAGEHVKYNDPDLIFYRADRQLPDHDLPYLKQAEMPSGYDWSFEKRGSPGVPWIGFMCESTSDFKWTSRSARVDISPELQEIMDSNALKCPADFDGIKWIPRHEASSARFLNLDVIGGHGFILDNKYKNGAEGSRFCFVHEDAVLIGVSGNGIQMMAKSNSGGDSIVDILKRIEFKGASTHRQ